MLRNIRYCSPTHQTGTDRLIRTLVGTGSAQPNHITRDKQWARRYGQWVSTPTHQTEGGGQQKVCLQHFTLKRLGYQILYRFHQNETQHFGCPVHKAVMLINYTVDRIKLTQSQMIILYSRQSEGIIPLIHTHACIVVLLCMFTQSGRLYFCNPFPPPFLQ